MGAFLSYSGLFCLLVLILCFCSGNFLATFFLKMPLKTSKKDPPTGRSFVLLCLSCVVLLDAEGQQLAGADKVFPL